MKIKYAAQSDYRPPAFRKPTPPPPPGPVRPCEVDGEPALFYRWVEVDQALLKINAFVTPAEQDILVRKFRKEAVIANCCSIEKIRSLFALVELPDGRVAKVEPELVRFTDCKN